VIAVGADIVHRDHARVRHARERLGLAQQSRALRLGGRRATVQQLDRDRTMRIVGGEPAPSPWRRAAAPCSVRSNHPARCLSDGGETTTAVMIRRRRPSPRPATTSSHVDVVLQISCGHRRHARGRAAVVSSR
jgi:hypothetical protein